jgi:hypothetical protein
MAVCLLLIPLSGFSQKYSQQSETPASYPKLIATGNPDLDKSNHEKAVQAWKQQERERIERLQLEKGSTNVSSKPVPREKGNVGSENGSFSRSSKSSSREIELVDLPGFPKYVITGDTRADEKSYQAAKAKWMDENPELYKEYIQKNSGNSNKKLDRRKPETSN